jgi:hypothetical protein
MFGKHSAKRQILGIKEKKQSKESPPWWGCLPALIFLALLLMALWQNWSSF